MPAADPRLDGVNVSDLSITSKNWGLVHCKLYASAKVGDDLLQGRKVGIHLNFHASGFIFDSLGMDRYFLERAALALDVLVIDVSYPKAPEYPFPSAIQSSVEVAEELLKQTDKYDIHKVSLSGFSSGGAVALALSSILGPARVNSVTAFYPMIDFEKPYSSDMAEIKHKDAIDIKITDTMRECYVVPGTNLKDPHLTLRYAKSNLFPRYVTVICGNGDTFYASSKEFMDAIGDSQGPTSEQKIFIRIENVAHNFDKMAQQSEEKIKTREGTYDRVLGIIAQSYEGVKE